jgi:hypothetical protein
VERGAETHTRDLKATEERNAAATALRTGKTFLSSSTMTPVVILIFNDESSIGTND